MRSGTQAFQAATLSHDDVKTLSNKSCAEMDSKAHVVLRTAAASTGGNIGSLWQSQLAEVGEKLVNAQFSHKQESEADDYSFDLIHLT